MHGWIHWTSKRRRICSLSSLSHSSVHECLCASTLLNFIMGSRSLIHALLNLVDLFMNKPLSQASNFCPTLSYVQLTMNDAYRLGPRVFAFYPIMCSLIHFLQQETCYFYQLIVPLMICFVVWEVSLYNSRPGLSYFKKKNDVYIYIYIHIVKLFINL